MPTLSQAGYFYPGAIGLLIRFELLDTAEPPQPLIPQTIALEEIVGFDLKVRRPNYSEFSRTLEPGAFVDGGVQYLTQDKDLTDSGLYNYTLTLILTGGRSLPMMGKFRVLAA